NSSSGGRAELRQSDRPPSSPGLASTPVLAGSAKCRHLGSRAAPAAVHPKHRDCETLPFLHIARERATIATGWQPTYFFRTPIRQRCREFPPLASRGWLGRARGVCALRPARNLPSGREHEAEVPQQKPPSSWIKDELNTTGRGAGVY